MGPRPHLAPTVLVLAFGCTNASPSRADRLLPFVPLDELAPAIEQPPPPPPELPIAVPPPPAPPDPFALALAPADPSAISIVARKAMRSDQVVLYAVDVAALRESEQPGYCEAIEQRVAACTARCVSPCSESQRSACLPADPYDRVGCLEHEQAFAWEIARVRTRPAPYHVVARTRLWGPERSGTMPSEATTVKLKIYDVDRDGRGEAVVVFPIQIPEHDDEASEIHAEIAAILDAWDLHVQFAVTRRFDQHGNDVFGYEAHAATTWIAEDRDGDGHPDLALSHKSRSWDASPCDDECEDDRVRVPPWTRAEQVCPWEAAGDRWVCPAPQLGGDLLGNFE